MGIKKSVMLSDQAIEFMGSRTNKHFEDAELESGAQPSFKWSEQVNSAFHDLSWLTRELMPDLSDAAWILLLNAYNGHFFEPRLITPLRLAQDCMEYLGCIDLASLDEETAGAIRTIHALGQPQQYAVYQAVRIYWANEWDCSVQDSIAKIKTML